MLHPVKNFQSPFTADDYWEKYDSPTPRQCILVYIEPKAVWGGADAALGFTSNSRNMANVPGFDGIVFKATPAISPTTCEIALDAPGNLELTAICNPDSFTDEDITAGKWNFAKMIVMTVCWDELGLGQVWWHTGYLGEIKMMQTHFTAESRGPLALLSQEIAKVTARLCRVREFQDEECGHTATTVVIDSETYNISHTLTVSAFDPEEPFEIEFTKLSGDANDVPADFFAPGKITVLGATANGLVSREILSSETGASIITVQLKGRRFPFPIIVGQQFTLKKGCDRTINMCVLYDNIENRQAEDFTPTLESANRGLNTN